MSVNQGIEEETEGGGLGSVLVCRVFKPSVKYSIFRLFCVLDLLRRLLHMV